MHYPFEKITITIENIVITKGIINIAKCIHPAIKKNNPTIVVKNEDERKTTLVSKCFIAIKEITQINNNIKMLNKSFDAALIPV